MRSVFVCFLEEIEESKKAFRNYLTFKYLGDGGGRGNDPGSDGPVVLRTAANLEPSREALPTSIVRSFLSGLLRLFTFLYEEIFA